MTTTLCLNNIKKIYRVEQPNHVEPPSYTGQPTGPIEIKYLLLSSDGLTSPWQIPAISIFFSAKT